MKKRAIFSILSILIMCTTLLGSSTKVSATETDDSVQKVTLVVSEKLEDINVVPGMTTHVIIPVRSMTTATISNVITSVKAMDDAGAETGKLKITNVRLSRDGITGNISSINFYEYTNVEFDVVAKETVNMGQYYFNVSFTNLNSTFSANALKIPCNVNSELQPAELTVNDFTYKESDAIIGNSINLSMKIKNEGQRQAKGAYITVDYKDSGLAANYATKSIKVGDLKAGELKTLRVPVKILKKATEGSKELSISLNYKDVDGNKLVDTREVYVNVAGNETAPSLQFDGIKYAGELKVGNQFNVIATISNVGVSDARNIKVSISEGLAANTFIPNFTTGSIAMKNITKGKKSEVSIPLIVSKDAEGGVKPITILVKYEDASGVAYEQKTTIYPEVKAQDGVTQDGKPNIIIGNVNQSPAAPNAGSQVNVSFEIENKSNIDIKEVKVEATNLSTDTFRPTTAEPYKYIEVLKGGSKKRVNMSFDLSKKIPEGMNTVEITYTYLYGKGNMETGKANLYVLDIVNDDASLAKSVPKIIISDFSTSEEELRAGSTFNFNFVLKNTHTSVAAKNIKVTVSQAENFFSITSGSNSMFIDKIEAGTTHDCTMELKVKSDAVTKAYPLEIVMEYEYDGAVASPVTGEVGEKVTEKINLQAVENTRPEVDNISLDTFSTPTVGQSLPLRFEFYNLGQSPLKNVCAKVSGDFKKAEGDKAYIGNIDAGNPESVEFDVIPLVEGDAKGTITITFEDSSGETVSMDYEFSGAIQGEVIPDFGGETGIPEGEGMGELPAVKKAIMPVWLFVIIQVVIVLIFVPVTKKIIITAYKKKLEKSEEEL